MNSIGLRFHLCYRQTLKVFQIQFDKQYKDNMNTMKDERKGKTPYTENINTHGPSGWCAHSTFPYGDVPDPLKMYRGKDCVEKFIEHIEDEVKLLYTTFL